MKFSLSVAAIVFLQVACVAQQKNDSIKITSLDSVIVNAQLRISGTSFLPNVNCMNIYAGKRTNDIILSDKETPGLELNLGRTALARYPALPCGKWTAPAHN